MRRSGTPSGLGLREGLIEGIGPFFIYSRNGRENKTARIDNETDAGRPCGGQKLESVLAGGFMAKKRQLAVLKSMTVLEIDLRLIHQPEVRGISILFGRQGL